MKDLIKQQNQEVRKKTNMIKEENLNEVNFDKIKLPSVVNRFLNKFVDSMKGANLNRMKRAAILYKVIDAAGMTPQQLMADIQKIKTAMKND
jgi:ParB-like chromosome segregation protein Spo0J